jgi:hypothetical protein
MGLLHFGFRYSMNPMVIDRAVRSMVWYRPQV